MKIIILIAIIAFAAAEPDFYYFFEDLNLNSLLTNDEEIESFLDCVLDRGPCTELYDPYKDLFSAAVKNKCIKCTPYQGHLFWLFLQEVEKKYPEDYDIFKEKYDPDNEYFDDLLIELQHRGIAM